MQSVNMALRRYFDSFFYTSSYPEVIEAGVDPFTHFCSVGWREGRNPSAAFDTNFYLQQYPDILSSGINPLLHYVQAGQFEGRRIMPPLREERRGVQHAFWSMVYRSNNYQPEIPEDGVLSSSQIVKLIPQDLLPGPIVLSISHDDYRTNVGGVQKLIRVEESKAREISWNYLHLSPSCHRLGLATHAPEIPVALSLRFNGRLLGHVLPDGLLNAIQLLGDKITNPTFAIVHHLMGHDPEEIALIIKGLNAIQTVVWTHDFFTLCSGIQLMRNDVVYCHAPKPESMGCTICSHGSGRREFVNKIGSFFDRFNPVVMAPSEAAALLWRKHSAYTYQEILARPLGQLLLADSKIPYRVKCDDGPIRVAFLGYRTHLKGWTTFQKLALAFETDSRYEFHHLGTAQNVAASGNIVYTQVNNISVSEEPMIESVVARNIDIVINWAQWPETFCYAAYEAIAAGAFLIAPDGEGNVAALVRGVASQQGLLLKDENALFDLFHSGQIGKILKISNRRRGCILPSGDSISWLIENNPQSVSAGEVIL